MTDQEIDEMSSEERIKLYQEDPVRTARHFENRMRELLRLLLAYRFTISRFASYPYDGFESNQINQFLLYCVY